jgi:hypothetical protein
MAVRAAPREKFTVMIPDPAGISWDEDSVV